jgi:hypothetical protein
VDTARNPQYIDVLLDAFEEQKYAFSLQLEHPRLEALVKISDDALDNHASRNSVIYVDRLISFR